LYILVRNNFLSPTWRDALIVCDVLFHTIVFLSPTPFTRLSIRMVFPRGSLVTNVKMSIIAPKNVAR